MVIEQEQAHPSVKRKTPELGGRKIRNCVYIFFFSVVQN